MARIERIRNFCSSAAGDGGEDGRRRGRSARRFLDALADDFNTPRALGVLFELISEGNRARFAGAREALAEMLELLGLGVAGRARPRPPTPRPSGCSPSASRRAPSATSRAPTRLRDQLAELGCEIRDTPEGRAVCVRALAESCRSGRAGDRLRAPPGRRGRAGAPPGAAGVDHADDAAAAS